MNHYLWWIPVAIIFNLLYAWFSVKNNSVGGGWLLGIYLYGCIPTVWIFVSKYSKNLIFDGLLYDVVTLVAFMIGFMILGQAKGFIWINYVGIAFVITGFILIKS